nr:DUF1328 domain-containing protein [Nannocystis pusilla]
MPRGPRGSREWRSTVLYWSIVFFIVALVAAIFGFGGLAADSAYIAKILAFIGLILAVVTFVMRR